MIRPVAAESASWPEGGGRVSHVLRSWSLASKAFLVLTAVRMALRVAAPLPRILAGLTPRRSAAVGDVGDADWGSVEIAARHLDHLLRFLPANPGGSCLSRSLALYHLARRRGLPVRFHCGARREGEQLTGHAWLTVEGRPVFEADPSVAFIEMFSYP